MTAPNRIKVRDQFMAKLTARQLEALALLRARDMVMLYGGSRSGKTFLLVCMILLRAAKYPGSRHLIARLRYAHARASIWLDTLPAAVKFLGIESIVQWHESDHYLTIRHAGGIESEIWVDGLDDRDRVDKILGREYLTIYLNEGSQIAWSTVTTVLTRLAQKIKGCKPKFFCDENPPSKFHWSNRIFLQGVDPTTGEPIDRARYGAMQVNPEHNAANLPDGYITDILDKLPPDKRRRFLLGEFGDAEGVIFKNWDIIDEVPEEVRAHSRKSFGLDLGFSVDPAAAVALWLNGDDLWVDELLYSSGLTNPDLARALKETGILGPYVCDSSEPKSIRELHNDGIIIKAAAKGPDSVRHGIDWIMSKRLHVTRRSVSLQAELENYCWRENREGKPMPEPIDDWNHAIDAIRYGCEPWSAGVRQTDPGYTSAVKRRAEGGHVSMGRGIS
ncbi:MAG: phage terminase large subunit [Patescibacteria group bacterium]